MEVFSTQERDPQETARVMCECVNNLLTDISFVSQQVSNKGSDSQMVLQFLHHCTESYPECYVVQPDLDQTGRNTLQTEKHTASKDFTFWVLSRLLRIIAAPGCAPLHEKAVSVFKEVLHVARVKDVKFYRRLITELIGLYKDVSLVFEDFYATGENDQFFAQPMFSGRFQKSLVSFDVCNPSMPPKLIELSSIVHCQHLLVAISGILEFNLMYIEQFVHDCHAQLFEITYAVANTFHNEGALSLLNKLIHSFSSLAEHAFLKFIYIYITFFEKSLNIDTLSSCMETILTSTHVNVTILDVLLNKFTALLSTQVDQKVEDFVFESIAKLLGHELFNEELSSENIWSICLSKLANSVLNKTQGKSVSLILESYLSNKRNDFRELLKSHLVVLCKNLEKSSKEKRLYKLNAVNIMLKVYLKTSNEEQKKELFSELENVENKVLECYQLSTKSKQFDLFYETITFVKTFVSFVTPSSDFSARFFEICTIPWVRSIDPPWFDYVPHFHKHRDLLQMHETHSAHYSNGSLMNKCLYLVQRFPNKNSPTWIAHILRTSLTSPYIKVQLVALQYLPSFTLNQPSLITEDLLALARTAKPEVMHAVGRCIQPLICMMSKSANVNYSHNGKITVHCQMCADTEKAPTNEKSEGLSTLFKPFFQLLRHTNAHGYKTSLMVAFESLLVHSRCSNSVWQLMLELGKDPDFHTRLTFCVSVGNYMKHCVEELAVHQLIVSILSSTLTKSLDVNDLKVAQTLLLTMSSIARNTKGDLLSVMIVSLFKCFIMHNNMVAAIASDQLSEVSESMGVPLSTLFADQKNHLCDIIVQKVQKLLEVDNRDSQCVTDVFTDIAKLLQFPDVKAFLQATTTEMLPKIVMKISPNSSRLLRLYAKHTGVNRREMMFYNFKYIFSYLVRTITKHEELEACLRYLQEETDVELSSLLLSEYQSVFNQLLLYISVNREQVMQGFSILACNDAQYHGPKEFKSDAQLAVFLHQKLLGVLAFFNSVLTHSPHYERKVALQSINCLLNIMGAKYLTPVRLKVMAILKLSLRYKNDFAELCCSAWASFVRNIEVECLGPLLGQIIATLLPLVQTCPNQITEILTFLMIENRSNLGAYFKDIYFMPDLEVLRKFHEIIASYRQPITNMADFKEQVRYICRGAENENEDVRQFALLQLTDTFESHAVYLNQLLSNVDSVDALVVETLNTLLKMSCENAVEAYPHIAKCLGVIGAIDPGRVENSTTGVPEDGTVRVSVNDSLFAYELLQELCRSFLAASSTRAQDCAAFAIQETLAYYQCTDKPSEKSAGYELWQKFSGSEQELLYPHLHSKYINSATYNWAKLPSPVFGNIKGRTYDNWVVNWTNYLIFGLGKSTVFHACMSIIKHDLKMALFLLPHVVLQVLLADKTDTIRMEMMTVLRSTEEATSKAHAQTVFSVIDFLNQWVAQQKPDNSKEWLASCERVGRFVESIPQDVLANSSFQCNALQRSLMYYEQHMHNNEGVEGHLEFLQRLYCALDEPDGITGVAATRQNNTTLPEQIVEHESKGNYRDAVACYERAIQMQADNVTHHKGLLQCLIGLGQLHNALMGVSGVIETKPEWKTELEPYKAEVCWRLGQWDTLQKTIPKGEELKNWSFSLSTLLLSLKEGAREEFHLNMKKVRTDQLHCLRSSVLESGGYQKAYKTILRVHMLEDIESCALVCFGDRSAQSAIKSLDRRLRTTDTVFRAREPLLHMRKILLQTMPTNNLQQQQDYGWLVYSRIARKAGLFQTAYSSLLNVNENNHMDILIEKAKWYSSQNDVHKALLTLQKESSTLLQSQGEQQHKLLTAKVSLLKAQWMEATESYEPEPVLLMYKQAVSEHTSWEKGHFCLAKYYEKLMNACDENEVTEERKKMRKNDFVRFVIRHYGDSLKYGSKYIYQSMPRLLTLWLDFGALATQNIESSSVKQTEKTYFKEKTIKLNDVISKFVQEIPARKLLTAISQLVSRISHPNNAVWNILEGMLCKIFVCYKQQAMWSMVAVCKSSVTARGERCKQVFNKACKQDGRLTKFISDALDLTDRLLDICNRRCTKESKLSMKADFASLTRLMADKSFSPIMVPLQCTLTVQLPSSNPNFDPFPDSLPMMSKFEDQIDVLSSLQKPKKVKVLASDGRSYTLMCKPKDDLRKDGRLMEFNALVNKMLVRDPVCRSRQLHIRTYAVIPLNEECGLLEWVPNTTGLRYILNKIYKERNQMVKVTELRQLYEPLTQEKNVKKKVEIFTKTILPRYPPVFDQWFISSFPNPSKWYAARLAYSRTSAVISMVGYTLGLGDRHGENILFDSVSGDCVHVDFNCLFNKGETFDCPELVPFRLTHNMVKAMGPLGYEGVFRTSCEVTMKLMRDQKDSLLSVLNTFVHDPLLEWKKETRKKSIGEVEVALKILKAIEKRLAGYITSTMIHLPLSIEGQVHQLIKESTCLENLSRMYIGWAAYM